MGTVYRKTVTEATPEGANIFAGKATDFVRLDTNDKLRGWVWS